MIIQNYSYKPQLHFCLLENESSESVFTYGFELEVKRDPAHAYEMKQCKAFVEQDFTQFVEETFGYSALCYQLFCCKWDGSVRDGFEIVSQPMSWGWFMENVNKFEKLIRWLNEQHYVSEKGGQCGLHFHIGDEHIEKADNWCRNGNGETYLLHVASNMQRIMSFFKNEFISFSRRNQAQIDRWCALDNESGYKSAQKKAKQYLKNRGADRYRALNLTNSTTLEVRLMRGTTNFDTFFLTFNLVKNLAEFSVLDCKPVSFKMLVYTGLDGYWTGVADDYLARKGIICPNKAVYTGTLRKKMAEQIDARLSAILG